jgi:toxin ParE1/3/4
MKVRYTAPASHDLDAIYNYISERNPTAAQRVKSRIKEAADQSGDAPLMGRQTDRPEVRLRTVNPYPYLIFYAVRADEVPILHIRHGAPRPLSQSDD